MRTEASHGKPILPTMPERINEDLVQFVGPSSFKFYEARPRVSVTTCGNMELDSSFN